MTPRARVLAGVAAIGATAGFVGLVAWSARKLIEHQAAHMRSITGTPLGWTAPNADGYLGTRYGAGDPKNPDLIRLVVLGDSVAAGLGASRPAHVLGARLARRAARRLRRPVHLRTVARIGAESSDLDRQLRKLGGSRPDLALIIVGGNDVLHRRSTEDAGAELGACVRGLRERGTEVIVGTCPDLGSLTQVPQPLRSLASLASRRIAAAQRRALVGTGAHVVDLAGEVGALFVADPEAMFALDRFHPSSLGYRRTARALRPALRAALDGADLRTRPTAS